MPKLLWPDNTVDYLKKAQAQFNAGDYWETHETLEPLWLVLEPPQKTLTQAFIQSAAAFVHFQQGNRKGTLSLLKQALDKFNSTQFLYKTMPYWNTEKFVLDLQQFWTAYTASEPGKYQSLSLPKIISHPSERG